MSKFDLKMIIFAICMCLFVGFGSYNYRVNNVMLNDEYVPLSGPIFDYGSLDGANTVNAGETYEVIAYNSTGYEVTALTLKCFLDDAQCFSSNVSKAIKETIDGKTYNAGYSNSFTVSPQAQDGQSFRAELTASVKDSEGKTSKVSDTKTFSVKGLGLPKLNDSFKITVNGSSSPSSVSVRNKITFSCDADFDIYQMLLEVSDSKGDVFYRDSEYGKEISVSEFYIFTEGKNLNSCKVWMKVLKDDTKKTEYTNTLTVNFVDDKPRSNVSEGTFQIDSGKSPRDLSDSDEVKFKYIAHSGESIEYISLELVDERTGTTIVATSNNPGSNSKITTLDLVAVSDRDDYYDKVKVVAKVRVDGETFTKTVSGYSINQSYTPGTIKIINYPDNKTSKMINKGTNVKFNSSVEGNGTLDKVTVEFWKNGKKYNEISKNVNSKQYEFDFEVGDEEVGDVVFSVYAEGTFNGKSLDAVREEFRYEVVGEYGIFLDSNIDDGDSVWMDYLTGTANFSPYAKSSIDGDGYLVSFTYDFRKKGSSSSLKAGVLKSGNYKTYETHILDITDYFKKHPSDYGDYTLTLKVQNNNGLEEKKVINFKAVKDNPNDSSKTVTNSLLILPDKKFVKPKEKITFNLYGKANKVKIEIKDLYLNKVVDSSSSLTGSVAFPDYEGTFQVTCVYDDNKVEKTYFSIFGDYIVDPDAKKEALTDLFLLTDKREFKKDETINLKAYYYNNSGSDLKDAKIKLDSDAGIKILKVDSRYKSSGNVITLGELKNGIFGAISIEVSGKNLDSKSLNKEYPIKSILQNSSSDLDSSMIKVFIFDENYEFDLEGYLTGYPDGTVKLDDPITRGEVSAIFTRAFDLESKGSEIEFKDVKKTGWAYPYVEKCAQNGIVTGYTDNTFKPNENITVNELAAMIYRTQGINEEKAIVVKSKYETRSSWDKPYISGLDRQGMLNSLTTKDTTFKATRGDVIHLVNEAKFLSPDNSLVSSFKDSSKTEIYNKDAALASKTGTFVRTKEGKVKEK